MLDQHIKAMSINCSDYDILEQLATLRIRCIVRYVVNDQWLELTDTLQDLYVKEGEEWCRFTGGTELKTDQIRWINGRDFGRYC